MSTTSNYIAAAKAIASKRKVHAQAGHVDDADLGKHMDKHIAEYKRAGGAEALMGHASNASKKLAKSHGISAEAASIHINRYLDKNLTESTELEEGMSGGEKAAYRMGSKHGASGVKKINAEQAFGVHSKFYHMGYDSGKEGAEWHATQKDKTLVRNEEVEQIDEISSELAARYVDKSIATLGKRADAIKNPNNEKSLRKVDIAGKKYGKTFLGFTLKNRNAKSLARSDEVDRIADGIGRGLGRMKVKEEVEQITEEVIPQKEPTKKHHPLMWSGILGTVYARNPKTKEIKYFDYDHEAAKKHAGITDGQVHDLRKSKWKGGYTLGGGVSKDPNKGQMVIHGRLKEDLDEGMDYSFFAKAQAAKNKAEKAAIKASQAPKPRTATERLAREPKKIDLSDPKLHKAITHYNGGTFEHFEHEPKHFVKTLEDGKRVAGIHATVTHSYTADDLGMHPDEMQDTAETYHITAYKHPTKGYILHHRNSAMRESIDLDEQAKWRKEGGKGSPTGLGKTFVKTVTDYGEWIRKEPIGREGLDDDSNPIEKSDPLTGRATLKTSTRGKPLLAKSAQRNVKNVIKQTLGTHGKSTLPEETELEEGFIKKIKRSLQGWDTKINDGPKELVKKNKAYDDKTIKLLAKDTNMGFPFGKDADQSSHSPRGLQKRVLNREIQKRGIKMDEARQRIPLEGHPYHSKSNKELKYIIKDAGETAQLQKGMSSEGKYLDQVNDASTILYHRLKNGIQEGYASEGSKLQGLTKGLELQGFKQTHVSLAGRHSGTYFKHPKTGEAKVIRWGVIHDVTARNSRSDNVNNINRLKESYLNFDILAEAALAPFTNAHLVKLQKEYAKIKTMDVSSDHYKKLTEFMDKLPPEHLQQIKDANVPWLRSLAQNRLSKKKV